MDAIGFLGLLVACGGAWDWVDAVREWDIDEIPPRDWVVERVRRLRPEFVLPAGGAARFAVAGFGGIAALTYGDQRFVMTAVRSPRHEGGWVQLIVLCRRFSTGSSSSGLLPVLYRHFHRHFYRDSRRTGPNRRPNGRPNTCPSDTPSGAPSSRITGSLPEVTETSTWDRRRSVSEAPRSRRDNRKGRRHSPSGP